MDNNNSLPYGAISSISSEHNVIPNQRLYAPSQSTLGSDISLQDPISVARNVHHRSSVPRDRVRIAYNQQESGRNLVSGNEGQLLSFPNQRVNGVAGITGVSNSSTGSYNSLINHEAINNQILTSNEENIATTTGNLFGVNRYFHAPMNGFTLAERPNTNSYRPLDHATGRVSSQLPTLTEQNPIQPGSCTINTAISKGFVHQNSKKHSGIKRRVSREDSEDGIPRPASKLLLTEEKMAAKMHNLSISNDHCYHINGLPTQLAIMESSSISPIVPDRAVSEDEEVKEDDNNNMESANSSGFVLAPGYKEMLAKSNHILPQTILDQMTKPCMAVIPWKPPDDFATNLSFNFSNKTDDEKMAEKDYKENDHVKGHQLFTFGSFNSVDHTEEIEDCGTFDLDDDDMDL